MRVQLPTGIALTQIATGLTHACGRASDGSAYCWGDNASGQLGEGSFQPQATPVAVMLPSGVRFAQLSGGGSHSCGLTPDGAAYCWGSNAFGQIGDGTGTDRGTPAVVRMP